MGRGLRSEPRVITPFKPLKQAGGLNKESEKELRAGEKKKKIKETVFSQPREGSFRKESEESVY